MSIISLVVETDDQFLLRIRGKVETEEDLEKIGEYDLKRLLPMKNLATSNTHDENLNTLRYFCRLSYKKGTCPNPFYQTLLDALYAECYKRRVAATNEDSQRLPKDYVGLYRYACEWRYGSALLVVLITVCLTFRFYLGRK
jgi:hypothetical protein